MHTVFLKILNLSISAIPLTAAAVLIRFVLKKAPKKIICIIWAITAVRLICPFSVESLLSLVPSAETIPRDIEMMSEPAIDSGIEVINEAVNPIIQRHFSPGSGESANPIRIIIHVLTAVWLTGIVVMTAYALISYLRLKRSVRASVPKNNNIFLCDEIGSPFLLGFVRPKIYVPSSVGEEALGYITAHEKAHISRLDHLWKAIGFLILSVYWFDPLCWLSYILFCRDTEGACDERVIRDMGAKDRAGYSRTLLECSIPKKTVSVCLLAFGEINVKERVKNVLDYKKPRFAVILISVIICAAAAVCFLTHQKKNESETFTPTETRTGAVTTETAENTSGTADDPYDAITGIYECEISQYEYAPFGLGIYPNGTFSYYETPLSSHVGTGVWEYDGHDLVLTEHYGNEEWIFVFTSDGTSLVYDAQRSHYFLYARIDDGVKFHLKSKELTPDTYEWYFLMAPERVPLFLEAQKTVSEHNKNKKK